MVSFKGGVRVGGIDFVGHGFRERRMGKRED